MERVTRDFLTVILIVLASGLNVNGKTISPAENGAIKRFVGFYDSITSIEGKSPSSWATIAKYDEDLEGFRDYFPEGQSIDSIYSFISKEDRSKFPDGELLLIRSKPMKWPDVWKHTPPDIDPAELTEKQRDEFKRLADREQPIRYLIYRNEAGDIDSVWWFEEDVQTMLAETGIKVPAPEPYQPTLAPPPATSSAAVETMEEISMAETRVKEPAEVKLVEVAEETPEQPSQWWLWLVGVLVVLGGLALVVRRKS